MIDFFERHHTEIVNLLGAHPWIVWLGLGLVLVVFLASLVVAGIEAAYPPGSAMPTSAAFWHGFLNPVALNFIALVRRFGGSWPGRDARE